MSNITYPNKQAAVDPENPQSNEIFTAANANEIKSAVNSKQDALVSGTSIKTINGVPILGAGNINIEGGEGGGGAVEAEFIQELLFDADKFMSHTQVADIAFSLAEGANILGKVISIKLDADEGSEVTFSSEFKILSGSIDAGKTNYLYFNFVSDTEIRVTISFEGGSVEAGIIGAPLLEGKILIGDENDTAKAVSPTGDINIDGNGVVKFGSQTDTVKNKHIPFRDFLGNMIGSDALRFAPDTGFDVSTDLSPIDNGGTQADYVGNVFKSKIRSNSTSNTLTQKAWVFETDLESKADVQHLTGFHVKNKLDRKAFGGNYAHFFKVTNFEGGQDRDKFVVGNDGNGNEFVQFSNFLFKGDRVSVGGALELWTNDGFSYLKAAYFGVRFQLPVTVGSTNAGGSGAQLEVVNNNILKPATAIDGGILRHYRQSKAISANSTPTSVFEMTLPLGEGFVFEITLSANTYRNGSYFVFTTAVFNDNDGLLAFIGDSKKIVVEENSYPSWQVTTAIDQVTKKFEVFFSKDTVGDVAVTASVKTTKLL